ncbi:DUF4260 domain-containing protein [Pelagibacterium limicola]|uniref:DUF4260 domain-containing protein n=1 Tax=Pelagibacterium limicola TaxID=2791022 RepID=UPI0018AFC8A6|nr:DUF4260 domain-containing protein [Pelagibacterium limicola]
MDRLILWLRIEGALVFAAGVAVQFHYSELDWWVAVLVFFAPDLSFAAYALGPRVGAFVYNAVHVYAFGAVVFAAGILLGIPVIAALGILWLAHSGFDRMFGYGLKSDESFHQTHLGPIGRGR